MSKKLVAYFSASSITAKVAENLADSIGANLFEIRPEVIYTSADLDWTNKKSRSSLEMSDPTSRPAIAKKRDNMDEYDTIFVEFPIWWYIAPKNRQVFQEGITGSHTQIADIAQTKIPAAIPFFYYILFPLYIFIAQINLQSFKDLSLSIKIQFKLRLGH